MGMKPAQVEKVDADFLSFAVSDYNAEEAQIMAYALSEKLLSANPLSHEQTIFLQRYIADISPEQDLPQALKAQFSNAGILLNNDDIISESEVTRAREVVKEMTQLIFGDESKALTQEQLAEKKLALQKSIQLQGDVHNLYEGYLGAVLERNNSIEKPELEKPTIFGVFTGENKMVEQRNAQTEADYAAKRADTSSIFPANIDDDKVVKQVLEELETINRIQIKVLDDMRPYGGTDNSSQNLPNSNNPDIVRRN